MERVVHAFEYATLRKHLREEKAFNAHLERNLRKGIAKPFNSEAENGAEEGGREEGQGNREGIHQTHDREGLRFDSK